MALRQLCSDKQQRSCKAARLPPVWLGKPCRPRHCAASQPAAEPGPTPTLCRHPGKRRALHRAQHQGHHTDTSGRASGRHPQAAAGDEASGQQPASLPAWQGLQLLLSQQGCRQQTVLPSQTVLPLPSDAVALHAGQGQTCCPGVCSGFYRH